MKLTAAEICKLINGEIQGNPNIIISSFSNIEEAQKGDITFLSDMRYQKHLKSTEASLIIVPKGIKINNTTTITVNNPVKEFLKILNLFVPKSKTEHKISKNTRIGENVKIGENVLISDFCIINNNVKIGDNCSVYPNTFIGEDSEIKSNSRIGPNVTIYEGCKIGENCIVHAGVVIGADGFGFISNDGELSKMPQAGKVIIKNNVEIGSNTTIDRGTLNNTIINNGVKLDNLIQIGHNVNIGENTMIAAQCGIAGSVKIGENCMLGGQVAVADHIKIGNNVKIAGKSGIIKNIPNNQILQGPLAFDIKDFQKSYIHFKNLDSIVSDLEKLKQKNHIAKNNKK